MALHCLSYQCFLAMFAQLGGILQLWISTDNLFTHVQVHGRECLFIYLLSERNWFWTGGALRSQFVADEKMWREFCNIEISCSAIVTTDDEHAEPT